MISGYYIGSSASIPNGTEDSVAKGHGVKRIMQKLGLTNDNWETERMFLEQACWGHDNKCEWAEEIATRRAAEGNV